MRIIFLEEKMSLTFSIDLASYIYDKMSGKEKSKKSLEDLTASVIIPAHNEEKNLFEVLRAQYKQTKQPKNIFVINDNSTDSTGNICEFFEKEYLNLICIHNHPGKGKAESISSVIRDYYPDIGDIVYINDGDLVPDENCLEELIKGFDNPNVAAVTGLPRLVSGGSTLSKMMTYGKEWQIQVLKWRKTGQAARKGMYVLCGAVLAVKKDILKQHPFPTRTKTEDLDYTWILNEKGYDLNFKETATCKSYDVTKFKDHWNQTRRWHKGAWQAVYCHGKDLCKAKGLLYTTLIPFWTESVLYLGKMISIPFLYSHSPALLASLAAIELGVNVGVTLANRPDYLKYLPAALAYHIMSLISYAISGVETTLEKIRHQEDRWKNQWSKNYEKDLNFPEQKGSFEFDNFLFLKSHLEKPCSFKFGDSTLYPDFYLNESKNFVRKIKNPDLKLKLKKAIRTYEKAQPPLKIPSDIVEYEKILCTEGHLKNPCSFEFYGYQISQDFYLKKAKELYQESDLGGAHSRLMKEIRAKENSENREGKNGESKKNL